MSLGGKPDNGCCIAGATGAGRPFEMSGSDAGSVALVPFSGILTTPQLILFSSTMRVYLMHEQTNDETERVNSQH